MASASIQRGQRSRHPAPLSATGVGFHGAVSRKASASSAASAARSWASYTAANHGGAALRLLHVVRALKCLQRMHGWARDALAQVIGDPRGYPGEGGAPEGALPTSVLRRRAGHATGPRRVT